MTQYMQEAGAMKQLTDEQIMSVADYWFVTGENQHKSDGYYYRSLGTPTNVRGSDLIEFARAILAAANEGTLTAGKQGGDGVAASDKPLEPVAWVSHTADGKPLIPTFDQAVAESWKAKGGDVRPLVYASGVASVAPALTDEQVSAEWMRWNLPGNDASLAFHALSETEQVKRAFKDGLRRGVALGVAASDGGQQ